MVPRTQLLRNLVQGVSEPEVTEVPICLDGHRLLDFRPVFSYWEYLEQ